MENLKLIKEYQDTKENKLLDQIIERNKGLVHFVLRRYRVLETDKEDLYQEGMIGLLRAVERFDTSKGVNFSTYAVIHIRATMRRYLDQRITKHKDVYSLNKTFTNSEGDEVEYLELIESDIDIEEIIKDKFYNEELQQVIKAHLSEEEQKAVYLYYYLDLTQKQVQQVLKKKNLYSAQTLLERGLRKIRRSPWGVREYKEIKEKRIDDKTNWIRNQRYDTIKSGNSHSSLYSPVENVVLQRERLRRLYFE